ncbi:response regulator [Pseudochryseolinea flava]|uniref:Response regulator n=1 Tax=Pseudochryseolinea flava TaxID=2059302 RepID=A0A364Y5F5_9BACT|nr:response regulator [Pseudochryseolinea flava]RAW01408.1 response regulator [Pseudochryseolinea flava]
MSVKNPIIIVDDDQDDQFLLAKVCEKIGVTHEILFFDDGRDALKYLRSTTERPFLIMSDVNMPLMNGFELRREIHNDVTLREKSIPFVFFSTAASPAQVREAYHLTVQGFFLKETSMEKIEQSLRMIFDYWTKCKRP